MGIFNQDAVDYLLKPFAYDRFVKAVTKTGCLDKRADGEHKTLMIKDKAGLFNLKQADILYIEGCKDYIKIVTGAKTYIIYHTLKDILEKLDDVLFMRAHRSYIVNKLYVNRIHLDTLILSDQTFIPIGQVYKKSLIAKLN